MAENVRFGKTTEEICKNQLENSTPSATKSATNFAVNVFKGTKLERASWLNVKTKHLFLKLSLAYFNILCLIQHGQQKKT